MQLDDSDSQGHLFSLLQFWALPTAFSLDFDLLKRALWANWHSLVIRFHASSEQPGVLGLVALAGELTESNGSPQ